MTKQIIDKHDRERIKFELDKNFLVEAGAGSGKTTSLVDRMVNLIHSGNNLVNEIVAITFTRKAADELKTRFQAQLENVWKTEEDGEAKVRLELALQNIEQCFLGTVHSFCARILRERPVEAGLDLNFKELEDSDDSALVDTAWELYLEKLQAEDSGTLLVIAELGIGFVQLRQSLREMKNYPDVEWVSTPAGKPDLRETYTHFLGLLTEASRSIPTVEPDKGYDVLQKAITQAIRKDYFQMNVSDFQIIETFGMFDKKSMKPTLKKWESKEDAKEYDARIKTFFDSKISQLLKAWKEYCHFKVIDFLKPACAQYEQLKQSRSLVNFQDLLMKTASLLKDNAEVRDYFQQKYRCLLVDEFQDTDPIQAEIMFFLTSEDINEKNWQECKPRPGSLFVVGDPKQAIYRFRRADVDTYNRVKTLICKHGGDVLQLTMNFRTVNTVTEKLNSVFCTYLPEIETVYQAAYRPLNSFKKSDGSVFTGIRKLVIPGDKKEEIIENDAEMIAKTIANMIKHQHVPKEFMILTRYQDGMNRYASKLQDYGIPVSVSGEMTIGDTREFQEMLNLLNIFIDPTNPIFLVSTLRSTFFGFSDEELYQWKEAGGHFVLYSHIPDTLSMQTKEKFTFFFSKLQKYQQWIRTYPATVAIEKITEDIGFYLLLLAKNDGKRDYISYMQIIESIRYHEEDGHTTFRNALVYMDDLIHSKTTVVNVGQDENTVRIMNIHKAKGLEAPIVFLAHPAKKVDPAIFLSHHIKRDKNTSKGYFTFTKPNGFGLKEVGTPPNWNEYKEEELAYLSEEEIRILYVAATRAEKAVIISTCEGKNSKNPWYRLIEGIDNIEEYDFDTNDEIQFKTEEKSIEITAEKFNQSVAILSDWKEASRYKSFEKYSPTDGKEEIYTLGIEREAGGGKDWGKLVHEVFEKLVRGQDMFHVIKQVLTEHDFSDEREQEIWELVRHFENTPIWNQLLKAEIVLTEAPFTFKVNPYDVLYQSIPAKDKQYPFIVTGIIDLIYKFNGKWFIVDYKTDRPTSETDIPVLSEYYKGQLMFYTNAWEQLTNQKIETAMLYFTTFDKLVKINCGK